MASSHGPRSHDATGPCDKSQGLVASSHDATSPCDLLQGLVAGSSPIVCADLKICEISNLTATWLAQLRERQSAMREVEGSSPRPDQYLGS